MTTRPATFDIHAHILERETVAALNKALPDVEVSFTPIDDEFAVLTVEGVPYKPFPRGGWDVERRLADMARYGFDRQLVAVSPQTVLYDKAPDVTLTASRIQNDAIAARVAAMPEKFLGLATVPLQAPAMAAAELERAMKGGGIVGAMLGTNIEGRNLDWEELEPFWGKAEELGAVLLLHPLKVAGIDRQRSYYLQNFIGNPLDTTIAAACLVFGGVLERYPGLKIVLSHGGGFVPYQQARWIHGWAERAEAKVRLRGEPGPSIDRLIFDTILHDVAPLQFLVDLAGAERVMLGSDYPFDMGQYDLLEVIDGLRITAGDRETILAGAADRLIARGR
jgi:aminocarboxymuconate-semialdehyde decarboxylase